MAVQLGSSRLMTRIIKSVCAGTSYGIPLLAVRVTKSGHFLAPDATPLDLFFGA